MVPDWIKQGGWVGQDGWWSGQVGIVCRLHHSRQQVVVSVGDDAAWQNRMLCLRLLVLRCWRQGSNLRKGLSVQAGTTGCNTSNAGS
jgi:hypothetical protein